MKLFDFPVYHGSPDFIHLNEHIIYLGDLAEKNTFLLRIDVILWMRPFTKSGFNSIFYIKFFGAWNQQGLGTLRPLHQLIFSPMCCFRKLRDCIDYYCANGNPVFFRRKWILDKYISLKTCRNNPLKFFELYSLRPIPRLFLLLSDHFFSIQIWSTVSDLDGYRNYEQWNDNTFFECFFNSHWGKCHFNNIHKDSFFVFITSFRNESKLVSARLL